VGELIVGSIELIEFDARVDQLLAPAMEVLRCLEQDCVAVLERLHTP
jgi:hypothetical protein